MEIPIYQVDAFTSRVFGGNPASVCPLESWLDASTMQAIAAENNLSETAYFVANGADYDIRWFTPLVEIDLAGHPTLASAHVIFEHLETSRDEVLFHTEIGDRLTITREGDRIAMDFPSRPPLPREGLDGMAAALGAEPAEVLAARDGFAVFESAEQVRALAPNMARVAELDVFCVIATAPGPDSDADCDFVSRVFAPGAGIPEDPVTGSAHATLIPYWARRLGKSELFARQISARGGELWCRDRGDRVTIAGQAVTYMQGTLRL
jgi:PhzF family phenazine biosynthesis protein